MLGYSKHAEVTVPSLDDWEKSFRTGTITKAEMPEVKVLPVDFRSQPIVPTGPDRETALEAGARPT